MQCKFEKDGWKCPLEALEEEEYCYWHLPKDGKNPDEEKLKELKENIIWNAYLVKANLSEKNLENDFLGEANLQGAILKRANLQKAYLRGANLQGADLGGADLQGANLPDANLQEANFSMANLQEANLAGANLQKATLFMANLQGADLERANIQGVDLFMANLQGVNLKDVSIRGVNLSGVNLQRANLAYVKADSETTLDDADLRFANLYRSYLDETKTLRNAKIGEYDIHEIIADLMGKKRYAFLDFDEIKKSKPKITSKLLNFTYHLIGTKIIVFDKKEKKVIAFDFENEKLKILKEFKLEIAEDELERFNVFKLIEKIEVVEKDVKKVRRALYRRAYEIYNSLYYFYIQSGKLDEALKMHYRRSEARRKALKLTGKGKRRIANWLRSWIYDFFILKTLTGYGIKIWRPLFASLIIILLYAFLFWLTKGIVKVVNGKKVNPDFIDYIYHSIITFTSLGYANIQPNLSVGHIPQILAASESCLGALMIALLIFTITFRVSR